VSRDALIEVVPLLRTSTGVQLDSARYVALLAYGGQQDEAKTCEFFRLVRDSRLGAVEKQTAAAMVADLDCSR
jgi:hypothetical protein